MRPISVGWGRVYYGGTGASRLYFQVSTNEWVWLDVSGAPDFSVIAIGRPEPKAKWTRQKGDSIRVMPVKAALDLKRLGRVRLYERFHELPALPPEYGAHHSFSDAKKNRYCRVLGQVETLKKYLWRDDIAYNSVAEALWR